MTEQAEEDEAVILDIEVPQQYADVLAALAQQGAPRAAARTIPV
jgi:hypothetical protein